MQVLLVMWCPVPALDIGRAFSLLCGWHSTVRAKVYFLAVGVEDPRSSSKLHHEVGGSGSLSLERSHCVLLPRSCLLGHVTLICHLPHSMHAHKVQCCWHPPPHTHFCCRPTDNWLAPVSSQHELLKTGSIVKVRKGNAKPFEIFLFKDWKLFTAQRTALEIRRKWT